jgi:hypothetical protein
MHDLSLFCDFTNSIFVLELLTLKLLCMQNFSNIFISFWSSSRLLEKKHYIIDI